MRVADPISYEPRPSATFHPEMSRVVNPILAVFEVRAFLAAKLTNLYRAHGLSTLE